jgi:hypothetical protein
MMGMDNRAQRQQVIGLALIVLAVLLFLVLRRLWSPA